MSQVTTVETMSEETFVNLMEDMRVHYKSGSTVSYALPIYVHLNAQEEKIPDEAAEVTGDFQKSTSDFNKNQKEILTSKSKTFTDDKDLEKFKAEMNIEKEKAKTAANKNIDDYFDKMTEIGVKNPQARHGIVLITQKVTGFFMGIFSTIKNFVIRLVNNIVTWLKEAVKKVKHFFSNAANTVKNFFDHLFK